MLALVAPHCRPTGFRFWSDSADLGTEASRQLPAIRPAADASGFTLTG